MALRRRAATVARLKRTPRIALKERAAAATRPGRRPADVSTPCVEGPVIVVIDPGHGDIFDKYLDGGATFPNPLKDPKQGFKEKDLALAISKAMKPALLKEKSLVKEVHLTRERDLDDKLRKRFRWRIEIAKNTGAKIFVSIHLNSPNNERGHQIIYRKSFAPDQSKQLAERVSAAYSIVPPYPGKTIYPDRLAVLALGGTKVKAAILIETGFISNDTDRLILSRQPQIVADQLAKGVHDYIRENLSVLCRD